MKGHTDEQGKAAATLGGWQLVPAVLDLAAAAERLEGLDELLSQANTEADIRRRQLDKAVRRFAARLALTRHDFVDGAAAREKAAGDARDAAKGFRDAERDAADDLARLSKDIDDGDSIVIAAGVDAREAADAGLLDDGESPDDATRRWAAVRRDADSARTRLLDDAGAADLLAAEQVALASAASTQAEKLFDEAQQLQSSIDELAEDAATLADDPWLLDAGEGAADVEGDSAALLTALEALQARHTDAERQARRTSEDLAGRLAGLAGSTVSVDADVRAMVQMLRDGNVGAMAGWPYIAEAVAADERLALVHSDPAAVAGILLTGDDPDDLDRARTLLADADPATAVTVTSTAALHRDATTDRIVIAPSAERYDPDAAEALRHRLTDELERAEQAARGHAAAIHNIRDVDRALRSFITRGGTDLPGLRDKAAEALRKSQAAEDDAKQARGVAGEQRKAAEDARADAVRQLKAREDAQAAMDALADALASHRAATAAQAARPSRIERRGTLETIVGGHRAKAVAAEAEQEGHTRAAAAATAEANAIITAAAADDVTLPADLTGIDVAATRTLPDTQALRVAVRDARRELAEATPDAELVADHEQTTGDVARLSEQLAAAPAGHRTRAQELAASPQAQTATGRSEATEAARVRLGEVAVNLGRAKAELETANEQLEQTRPRDRSRFSDLAAYPAIVTAEDAAAVLSTIEERVDGTRTGLAKANERVTDRTNAAKDARQAGELFDSHATSLDRQLPPIASRLGVDVPPAQDGVPQFTGAAADAKSQVDTLSRQLTDAAAELERTADEVHRRGRQVADEAERHVDAHEDLRVRLARFRASSHAANAGALVADLNLMIAHLEAKLAEAAEERSNVIERLSDHTERTFGLLQRLERGSKIPESITEWAGQPFVKLKMSPPNPALLRERITTLIDGYLTGETVPKTAALNLAALRHSLGEEGLKVNLLKPTDTMVVTREPVESFRASDGQRVTAAIMLYCTLARMRWIERGLDPEQAGGMLWLDNPFGKASKVDLVELQRSVAEKMGVQLLYLTGIKDVDAVSSFTRCNGLVKASSLRGRTHVITQGEGVSGASLWRRRHAA